MNTTYRAYGLTLQSDLALSGLHACPVPSSSPDLTLAFVQMPGWAECALNLPVTAVYVRPSQAAPQESAFVVTEFANGQFVLLKYGDGTRFLIDDLATQVWGEPGPGLTHDDLCVYLLGPVMGFLLRKRGASPLHASAVSIREHAVALVGEAGAGKSTTAAALALRGWPVLCEDVCALDETAGQFYVVPAYPRVQLWPDSVQFLTGSPNELPLIVRGWEKRFLPLDRERASFASEGAPLSTVYLLARRSSDEALPQIEPISRREACLQLVQNTYMNWLMGSKQRAVEFDFLTRLVSSIECFRITPSSDPLRLPKLAEMVESHAMRARALATDPVVRTAQENV